MPVVLGDIAIPFQASASASPVGFWLFLLALYVAFLLIALWVYHDAPGVIMEQPVPAAAKPVPKSRAVWIAVAVIVVIVVVLLAAALGGLFNPAAPAKPALRIGTLLSITGALSDYGPGDTQGAYL